jgi:hypothetical protein
MTIAHGDEKKGRILSPGPVAAFVIAGASRWESNSPLPLLPILLAIFIGTTVNQDRRKTLPLISCSTIPFSGDCGCAELRSDSLPGLPFRFPNRTIPARVFRKDLA